MKTIRTEKENRFTYTAHGIKGKNREKIGGVNNMENKKLSKLGKKAILDAYHIYYQSIEKGAYFTWHTNIPLTKNDLNELFYRLKDDTYNENCFVKNFVFTFMSIKWEDLLEE